MAGKKNRDRTEKTVCRENGKAMEMVIETESAQEEKQQIPGNESANADKKKQEEREAELPEAFLKRMKELLGEEFPAFLESYEAERVQGLRWNPLKGEPSSLVLRYGKRFGLSPVSWCAEGNYYDQKTRPGKHALHEAGIYYIQEPSAMAVTVLLDPQPGERILDLCAAPGGKTTHIAGRMRNQGLLVSNEIHPARAKILSRNVERMGIGNCVVTNEDSGRLRLYFPEFFDRIVVDAPCSGEGMFRKEEEAVRQWSEDHVKMCAARQREILEDAASMLKPGGTMVYSTCTFAPEENEGTILAFLKSHDDFYLEERECPKGLMAAVPQWAFFGADKEDDSERDLAGENGIEKYHLERAFRIMPHKTEGEGHFMAVLRRKEDGMGFSGKRSLPAYMDLKKEKDVLKELHRFLEETLTEPEVLKKRKEYLRFGDQLYLLPPQMVSLKGLKVLRPGLHIGTIKKNRFEPSHALALWLFPEDAKVQKEVEPDGTEAVKYLKGETLTGDTGMSAPCEKGWVLICTGNVSLGWGKMAAGTIKNHYPKGLRWM